MTNTQNTDFLSAGTDYTMSTAGSVTIGTTTYTAEVQTFNTGSTMTHLAGPRGAAYFLRGYRNTNGLFQVVSFKTGMPLRLRGAVVEVVQLGNVIEVKA